MEFFGFTLFGSLTGGSLLAVAAVIFVVGLVLTIKGGDWFVDSASWFAEATGIPKFVVGATVVSFATTLPELLVSVRAAMNGSAQLAIGNAVGSVTANTTLIRCVTCCNGRSCKQKELLTQGRSSYGCCNRSYSSFTQRFTSHMVSLHSLGNFPYLYDKQPS